MSPSLSFTNQQYFIFLISSLSPYFILFLFLLEYFKANSKHHIISPINTAVYISVLKQNPSTIISVFNKINNHFLLSNTHLNLCSDLPSWLKYHFLQLVYLNWDSNKVYTLHLVAISLKSVLIYKFLFLSPPSCHLLIEKLGHMSCRGPRILGFSDGISTVSF